MYIRVPLLFPVVAVIYRLDIAGTASIDPPGTRTSGLDSILRGPVVSDQGGVRTVSRAEMVEVRVPCQREDATYEELSMTFTGNDPVTSIVCVLHRKDLEPLGLLDLNGNCVLKPRDRIDHVETLAGKVVETFEKPLFIYRVLPGSHGMGPDGRDLHIVYTSYQSVDPRNAR